MNSLATLLKHRMTQNIRDKSPGLHSQGHVCLLSRPICQTLPVILASLALAQVFTIRHLKHSQGPSLVSCIWSTFLPIPKEGNAKECSKYPTIALISHTSKVMLQILQARLQQYVNRELPDVQAGASEWQRPWWMLREFCTTKPALQSQAPPLYKRRVF